MNYQLEENLKLFAKKYNNHSIDNLSLLSDFGMLLFLIENMPQILSTQEMHELCSYIIQNRVTAEELLRKFS